MDTAHLAESVSATAKAGLIIDLAVISLLVDKGILGPDELVERIEALHARTVPEASNLLQLQLEGILAELRARPGARA